MLDLLTEPRLCRFCALAVVMRVPALSRRIGETRMEGRESKSGGSSPVRRSHSSQVLSCAFRRPSAGTRLPEETEQFIPNRRLPGFVLRETERSKDGNQKDKSAHRCTEFMTTVSHKWFLIKEHSLLCTKPATFSDPNLFFESVSFRRFALQ